MYWLAQHRSILASLILILMGAVALGWQVQQHSTDRPGIVAQVIPAKSEPTPMPAPTLPVQSAVQPPPPAPPPLGDVKPVPQATGKISFESPAIHVVDAQSLVAIPVKRLNSTRGPGSVAWVIEKDSARPDVDHASLGWNIIKFIEGQSVRSIFIPLIGSASSDIAGRPRIFVVALKRVRGGPALGPISRITVTISRAGSDIDQRSAQMDGGGR